MLTLRPSASLDTFQSCQSVFLLFRNQKITLKKGNDEGDCEGHQGHGEIVKLLIFPCLIFAVIYHFLFYFIPLK